VLDHKRKPITKRDREAGEYPYYGATGVLDHVSGYLFDEPLVLVGEDGAKWASGENTAFAVEGKIWVNNHAHVLRPHRSVLLDNWLIYHLNHSDLTEFVSGLTVPKLNQGSLREFPVPVPPLAEQQRIVGLLDEAFEGLATAKANAEKNLQNARALFESHLQSVFTQKGEGWVETTLGEIGKVSMCRRIFKEETITTAGIPFFKIGTFGKEPDAFIPSQIYNEYRAEYPFPKKGDVLISASGTIGRRVRYDGEPAYFQDSNIVWIDNDEKKAVNDYLYHFYGACAWNSTKGATISRLYNDNLRRIVIAFPESLQEQRRIVAQLDELSEETQRLARLYERKLAALEELKKSLLHQAFAGEL
jgi:type I restriction enzyme S subunit